MLLHSGSDPNAKLRVRGYSSARTSVVSWDIDARPSVPGKITDVPRRDDPCDDEQDDSHDGGGVDGGGSMLRKASGRDLRRQAQVHGDSPRSSEVGPSNYEEAGVARPTVVRVKSRLRLGTGRSALELGVLGSGRGAGRVSGRGRSGNQRCVRPVAEYEVLIGTLRSDDPELIHRAEN